MANTLLLDLGSLHHGVIVKRPSALVKTGYVADVKLSGEGRVVQAHTPSLDCAGTIVPGRPVLMTTNADTESGKTSHAIQHTFEVREGGTGDAIICSHPRSAELIAKEMMTRRLLPDSLGEYESVDSQKLYGNCRVDFVLNHTNGIKTLVEVKNVVGADYPHGLVPNDRAPIGVYTSKRQPFSRAAIFPHGKFKPKIRVVSERAIKQVHEFTQMAVREDMAIRCAVLFIVNRGDCKLFRPCHEACPLFAQVLRNAANKGVTVLAHDVVWEEGRAYMGKELPVMFDECAECEVNSGWLDDVLDAAATSKAGRLPADWKPKSAYLNTKKSRKRSRQDNSL